MYYESNYLSLTGTLICTQVHSTDSNFPIILLRDSSIGQYCVSNWTRGQQFSAQAKKWLVCTCQWFLFHVNYSVHQLSYNIGNLQ